MRTSWMRRAALGSFIAITALGCAEERDPINTVQPNALAKSFFVGADLVSTQDDPEFYMRQTLVDVGYGADGSGLFTSTYAQPVSRIKWEITQDNLLARLTHEMIEDADGRGHQKVNNGVVVAAFRIEAHFDIRRSYNPSTGEESNVIQENHDRPWNAREYFRVDWSSNGITDAYDWDMLSYLGLNNGVDIQGLSYYVNDPASEDAPVFDAAGGYFDITTKLYASPRMITSPYGVTYPSCFWFGEVGGTYPYGNCNPTELKVRVAFKKLVDTDYEPRPMPSEKFGLFGAFYEERRGWDDEYGIVDSRWHRVAALYNIWKRSHVTCADSSMCFHPSGVATVGQPILCNMEGLTAPGGNPVSDEMGDGPNGTDDECEIQGAPAGSRCDQLSRKCTLPYAQREVKPIYWHFGPVSPADLWETTDQLADEWDIAMRLAVQGARYTECRRTMGASAGVAPADPYDPWSVIDVCRGQYPMDEATITEHVPRMVHFCHNPVEATDDPGCGAPGTLARLGDLRYNFVNVIPTPQTGSPWGIMVDGNDPLTGEHVQSSMNVWDFVTRNAAQGAVDVIRWLNGELSDESIKAGDYINKYAVSGDLKSKEFPPYKTMTRAEADRQLRGMSKVPDHIKALPTEAPAATADGMTQAMLSAYAKHFGEPVDHGPKIAGRLQAARDTAVEAELTTAPWMEIAGLDPSGPMGSDVLAMASPLKGNHFPDILALQHMKDEHFASRGMCMIEAPEPTAFVGLAKVMAKKFPIDANGDGEITDDETSDAATYARVRRMTDYMRRKLYYGVMLHEIGHSIGLRHNFVGSTDAFNFRPQYWQLRTNDGNVTAYCDDLAADGASCVGPRWHDPITDQEVDGLLWMWQHTTVMDYPGDVTQDALGLGPYDKAAARFFYGDTVDLWDENVCEVTGNGYCADERSSYVISKLYNGYGGLIGNMASTGSQINTFRHYSRYQETFGLIRDCAAVDTSPPANWDVEKNGVWDPAFDGGIVNGTKCSTPPVDYGSFRDLDTRILETSTGRLRWPHMFATDGAADGIAPNAMRHDNGADIYEQFNFMVNLYENRHIFDNFRRGRQTFTVRGAAARHLGRTHGKIRGLMQGFSLFHDWLLRSISLDTGTDYISAYEGSDGLMRAHALASALAFDHFTRVLTRPQSGVHYKETNFAGDTVMASDDLTFKQTTPTLFVPEGSQRFTNGDFGYGGRKVNNSFDNFDGQYDITWYTGAGSYYDKAYAIYNLTEQQNRFLEYTLLDFHDGRFRNQALVNVFPDGFRRLIASIVTGDTALTGPRVAGNTSGSLPEVEPKLKWPMRPLGWVSWWPEAGPEVCWPSTGTMICRNPLDQSPIPGNVPATSLPIEPDAGFEIQKFAIFWSLLFLPENWKTNWVEQFRIYSIGGDSDPDLPKQNALWFRDPESGTLYIARRYGTEEIFGKTVEKGIAARMLAWANTLVQAAYEVANVDPVTGEVTVQYADGEPVVKGGGACMDVKACIAVRNHRALIDFTRQTASTFGFPAPELKGINFN